MGAEVEVAHSSCSAMMITRRLARQASAFSQSTSWTCPSCTRAIAAPSRTTLAASPNRFLSTTRPLQRRDPPKLAHQDRFTRDGIPGLLSPEAFKIAWIDYQRLMVEKLDEITA